jgi:glycine cleavage system H protein
MGSPNNLKYLASHEWCRVEGDTAVIGISQHAVEQLTDLVYIDLPEPGTKVAAGTKFGEVESVKAVSELICPVSGAVTEKNSVAAQAPEKISADPYGQGWLIKVKMSNPGEMSALLDAATYDAALSSSH